MTPTIAILAGGLATRLHPVTQSIPKALVQVRGEPFAFHLLRLLRRNGFTRACFLVGHRGEEIAAAIGDGQRFGIDVTYVFDGPQLLGTGGAIAHALPALGEDFAVIYGDSWLDFDYQAAISTFRTDGRPALMTVYRNGGQWDTSNVRFENGEILAYSKTKLSPEMHHIDYGFGLFRREVFTSLPLDRPTDLASVYETLAEARQLAAFGVGTRFYEVGSFSGIADLERHLSGATT